jgi:predicted XRE-type DNA-binding protein
MTATAIHESSGNVFADLGLPDAELHFLKAQVVAELCRLARARNLTHAGTGAVLGISTPDVSRLFKGHFREYSIDQLLTFLSAFGQDIEIISRPRAPTNIRARGQITYEPVSI